MVEQLTRTIARRETEDHGKLSDDSCKLLQWVNILDKDVNSGTALRVIQAELAEFLQGKSRAALAAEKGWKEMLEQLGVEVTPIDKTDFPKFVDNLIAAMPDYPELNKEKLRERVVSDPKSNPPDITVF